MATIKRFGKTIKTPEQMTAYETLKVLTDEYHANKEELDRQFCTYWNMEGKYSMGKTADPYAGQGMRGYDYVYPSDEARRQEQTERDTFYQTHITPLKEREQVLVKEMGKAEEVLCIALWGYGIREYHLWNDLRRAEKELQRQIEYIAHLKEQIEQI